MQKHAGSRSPSSKKKIPETKTTIAKSLSSESLDNSTENKNTEQLSVGTNKLQKLSEKENESKPVVKPNNTKPIVVEAHQKNTKSSQSKKKQDEEEKQKIEETSIEAENFPEEAKKTSLGNNKLQKPSEKKIQTKPVVKATSTKPIVVEDPKKNTKSSRSKKKQDEEEKPKLEETSIEAQNFPEEIKEISDRALEDGTILQSVLDKIEENLTPEQFLVLRQYLQEGDVSVVTNEEESEEKAVDEDEENDSLEPTEKPQEIAGVSIISMLLQEISPKVLLKQHEEVALSKAIHSTRDDVIRGLCYFPFLKRRFISFKNLIVSGKLLARSFVDTYAQEDEMTVNAELNVQIQPQERKNTEQMIQFIVENIDGINEAFEQMELTFADLRQQKITPRKYKDEIHKLEQKAYNKMKVLRVSRQYLNLLVETVHKACVSLNKIQIESTKENHIEDFESFIQMPVEPFVEKAEALRKSNHENIESQREMIRSNLRLSFALAKFHDTTKVVALEESWQEGNIGLIKAVERFSHLRKCKFSTYASCWIKQNILRTLAERKNTLRKPVHIIEFCNKISAINRSLQNELGRRPLQYELSEAANISMEKLNKSAIYNRKVSNTSDLIAVSVDSEKTSADDRIEDKISPTQEFVFNETILKLDLVCAFAELAAREERVMRLRYINETGFLQIKSNISTLEQELGSMEEDAQIAYENIIKYKGADVKFDGTWKSKEEIFLLGSKVINYFNIVKINSFFHPIKTTLEEVGKSFNVTRERARQIAETGRQNIEENSMHLTYHLNLQNSASSLMT